MVTRIEIATTVFDTRADIRQKRFSDFSFYKKIKNVSLLDVYTVDKEFHNKDLKEIASRISNPVTQKYIIKQPHSRFFSKGEEILHFTLYPTPFTYAIEIGFLPGVTDNISRTTKEMIQDLLNIKFNIEENVYSSQLTFIDGNLIKDEINKIADSLYNPLIQRTQIKSYKEFIHNNGMDFVVPKVVLHINPDVKTVNLNVSDDELIKIGKEGIANADGTRRGPLALDLLFMKIIREYFNKQKRNSTDIELESIAQTWSEHCKHTIFNDPIDDIKNGLFTTYIKKATEEIRRKKRNNDFCVSVFTDNSGAIVFDDKYLITHKVETHNSPCALDPFGGAVTGIVGVNRDTLGFGLGAKPVANYYGFCLADPRVDTPLYRSKNKLNKMLSSRRIMDGVVAGVNAGGNQSGIPTPQGFVYFDEKYRGKPLVFVGTVGVIPKYIHRKKSWVKRALPGDYIVMVGGRVGKDGIHGATFSSEALGSESPVTAVQIGDPITQKKLSDAIVKEARDQLLYDSITDNGAGGLSCSVAEMAKESGGCIVNLEKVPLKYAGLEPWEIWISESQERMTLAVPKENWVKLKNILERHGVEATVIGKFTNSGKCIVKYFERTIMDLDMEFLHNGLPKRPMTSKPPVILSRANNPFTSEQEIHSKDDSYKVAALRSRIKDDNLERTLLEMLSSLNFSSFAFISQQYDYVVQANSVLPPLQGRGRINAEVSAIRPIFSSRKAVMMSQGLYPEYTDIDAYAMAGASIDTAIRNIVAAGGNPDYIALLDNFSWCSATEPERLYQLKMAAKACYDYGILYETPFISGKDSMFNDFKGFDASGKPVKISILPTLLISSIGVINDTAKIISLDAKEAGDLVFILGETNACHSGEARSADARILSEIKERSWTSQDDRINNASTVPPVDAQKNKKLYDAFYKATQKKLVASGIAINRGGLLIASAKKAMGGRLGMDIDLAKIPGDFSRNQSVLFSESQGRILVTIRPENAGEFEKIMGGNLIAQIGKVTKDQRFVIKGIRGKTIIDVEIDKMLEAYRRTFKDY